MNSLCEEKHVGRNSEEPFVEVPLVVLQAMEDVCAAAQAVTACWKSAFILSKKKAALRDTVEMLIALGG